MTRGGCHLRQAKETSFPKLSSPPALEATEVHSSGVPKPRYGPLSTFLTLSGGFAFRYPCGPIPSHWRSWGSTTRTPCSGQGLFRGASLGVPPGGATGHKGRRFRPATTRIGPRASPCSARRSTFGEPVRSRRIPSAGPKTGEKEDLVAAPTSRKTRLPSLSGPVSRSGPSRPRPAATRRRPQGRKASSEEDPRRLPKEPSASWKSGDLDH